MNGASRVLEDWRASATYSPLHAQSPGGGSGASTPVHNAPPVPSMLPRATGNNSSQKALPVTTKALRGLKLRKQAIHNLAKLQGEDAASISSLSDQLKVRETENLQLKEKLLALEHLPTQIKQLKDRLDQAPDHSKTLKDLQNRLGQLPDYSDSVVGLKREILKLEGVPKLLKELETASKKHSVQPSTDKELKNDLLKLRQWQEAKHKDIETLTLGFNALDAFKTRMEKENIVEQMQKMSLKIKKIDDDEERTHQMVCGHIEDTERYIGTARTEYEFANTTLVDRVKLVEQHTRKFSSVAGQIGTFQKQINELQIEKKQLVQEQNALLADKNAFEARLDLLEHESKGPGSGFSKVGTSVPTSTSQASDATTVNQLKALGEEVKGLQSAATDAKALATQITDINEQLNLLKERTDQIVTVEQKTVSLAQNIESLLGKMSSFDSVAADVKEVQTKVTTLAELRSKSSNLETRVHSSSVEKDKSMSADELNEIRNELSGMKTRLQNSAAVIANMASADDLEALRKELLNLNTRLQNTASSVTAALPAKDLNDIRKELSELATCVSGSSTGSRNPASSDEIETLRSQVADLDAEVQSQSDTLQSAETKIHIHDQKIGLLQNCIPTLFTDTIRPFKRTVEQKLEVFDRAVDGLSGEVNELKQQPTRAHTSIDTESVEQFTQNLKQEMVQFTTKVTNEVALREQETASHKDATTNAVDSIGLAFRSLQDQYNNINTDVLHGKMVQWFLQAYPSNAANMVQGFASLQRDVQNLRNSTQWIASQSQNIADLLADVPKLRNLVLYQNELQLSGTKIAEASLNAEQALTKATAAEQFMTKKGSLIQSMQNALSGIQESLDNLNSASSPFVRVAGIEFQGLKRSQSELRQCVENDEAILFPLRENITKIDDFLKTSREALGMYPELLELLSSVQAVVDHICKKQSLQIDWNKPIAAQLQVQQNGYADTPAGARQGKSKR
jgi:chromosome segregation ATPase